MATKCIVLGQENEPKKELKKIEFTKILCSNDNVELSKQNPGIFNNLVLIAKEYNLKNEDLIFAYNDNPSVGNMYLGHWNDGVV